MLLVLCSANAYPLKIVCVSLLEDIRMGSYFHITGLFHYSVQSASVIIMTMAEHYCSKIA